MLAQEGGPSAAAVIRDELCLRVNCGPARLLQHCGQPPGLKVCSGGDEGTRGLRKRTRVGISGAQAGAVLTWGVVTVHRTGSPPAAGGGCRFDDSIAPDRIRVFSQTQP